jgi:hypothetical protein
MKPILTVLYMLSSLSLFAESDTLNITDAKGLKQGYWIIWGNMKPEKGFCDSCRIEEGPFKDDRRVGEWTKYNNNGSIRCKGIYKNRGPSIGCGLKDGKWMTW